MAGSPLSSNVVLCMVLRCRGGAEVAGNTNSHLGSLFIQISETSHAEEESIAASNPETEEAHAEEEESALFKQTNKSALHKI
jgi:hypothetical protein